MTESAAAGGAVLVCTVGLVDFRPRQTAEADLTGLWRATPISPTLKRTGADADLDDSDWQLVQVPGHWGQVPELARNEGPILYRRKFAHRAPEADERLWLRFDGVLSGGEIWLDGTYVGDTTSYFASHRFDVTRQMAAADDHLLAVEVSCPAQGDSQNKSSLTGSLQAGHLAPPGNPGGIWREVGIDSTGPVAIRHSRLLCTKANSDQGELSVRLVLDAAYQTEIRIDTSVVGPDGVSAGGGGERHSLASGENRIEWSIPISEPKLWWPAALGDQPMYDVAIAVRLEDGRLTDRRDWHTGIRRVAVDNYIWRVNGQRLFTKGIAAGPAGRFLNATSSTALEEDVQAVRDAGLDLIRIYGHIGRDELYREADRLGLLIWQDLPLVGGYSSKVRSSAKAMARAAVDHLGHHPSVGLWCGHSEPNGQILPQPFIDAVSPRSRSGQETVSGADDRPDERSDETNILDGAGHRRAWDAVSILAKSPAVAIGRRVGRHMLPSWNRSVLDPVVSRELRNADRSRPVLGRSGNLPGPADLTGSDAHLWLGWHVGRSEELGRVLRRWPRLGAFLGGIGTQSVAVEDWDESAPVWATAERGAFTRYIPRRAYSDGRAWASATRAYQADTLRIHVETLRRLKYSPAGGFCIMALADAEPDGGFGVLDFARNPKPAHNVLIDACRPVVVIADAPPSLVVPGQTLALAVHVVSDHRESLGRVRVTGHAHRDSSGNGGSGGPVDGEDRWSVKAVWEGDVPPDGCLKVGDFVFDAPPDHGAVLVDFQLESTELIATNRYRTVVIPASEALHS